MREGTLYFFLKLNTEGNTSWEYEDTEKLNALYSSYLEEVKYNLCNNDGYFHLISIGFELKQNRIAVDFSYMLYDKFTEEFVDMLDDFIVQNYPDNRKKEHLRWLCKMIILHHPEDNCIKTGSDKLWAKLPKSKSLFYVGKDKGLAIGNLTSQICQVK